MKNPESYSRFAVFGGLFGARPVASIALALLCVTFLLAAGIHLPL